MKTLLITCLLALLALAGCASQMTTIETTYDKTGKPLKTTELRSDYAAYAAAAKPGTERPKLIDIECPATGCNFTKFAVYDPMSGSGAQALAAPPESLSSTFVKEMFATVRGVIPYAAGMSVLNKAFDKANSSVITNTTTDSSNRSVFTSTSTNTSATANGAGSSAATGGTASGSAPTTTTTTTNSNNTARTATGGNTTTGAGGSATTGP